MWVLNLLTPATAVPLGGVHPLRHNQKERLLTLISTENREKTTRKNWLALNKAVVEVLRVESEAVVHSGAGRPSTHGAQHSLALL